MQTMTIVAALRAAAALLLGTLAACTVLPKAERIAVERYTLEVSEPVPQVASSVPAADAPVLLVARPQVRSDLDTPRMAYQRQDYEIEYFTRSRWADTPPQLLLPGLTQALEASGGFGAVVRIGSPAQPRLRLDTELLDFTQDFRTEPSVFRLQLRAQLLDVQARRVLATQVFSAARPAPSANAYGGAQAANEAWRTMLPQLVEFATAAIPAE